MTINISTQPVEIARFAGALYGLVLDNATTGAVENQANAAGSSLNAVLNGVYGFDFTNVPAATVAATVAGNLGLTGTLATEAATYITAQLNAAAPGTQGQVLMNVLNLFSTLTGDATWGAAATAWENTVSQSVNYGLNAANTSNVAVSALASIGQTVTVTAGINQVFNGSPTGGTSFNVTNVSLNNGETLTGFGAGNVLNVVEAGSIDTTFGGAAFSPKITGIQTANLFAGQSIGIGQSIPSVAADTTAWTGLTQLNATAPGNITLKAAATTNVDANSQNNVTGGSAVSITGGDNVTVTSGSSVNVIGAAGTVAVGSAGTPVTGSVTIDGGNGINVNASGNVGVTVGVTSPTGVATPVTGNVTVVDTNAAGTGLGSIAVDGGSNVAITASGMNAGVPGVPPVPVGHGITVGAIAAPTGTVTINAALNNMGGSISGDTFGTISVTGGTVDTINETVLNATTTAANLHSGAVNVTGGSATTSVTVNQVAPVLTVVGANAAAGNGVVGVLGVNAAPGVQGVTAVTAVTPSVAPTAAVAAVAGNGLVSDGLVTIQDAQAPTATSATLAAKSGTIATVALSNFGGANISSAALKTLSLSGDSASPVNLYEGGSTAATNTTLALTTSAMGSMSATGVVTAVALMDNSNQYQVMNVTTGPVASYLNLTDTALTTLNVSGSSVLDLSQSTLTGNALTAVNVSGAAGFAGALDATATTLLAGASTGLDTITISADATKKITAGTNAGNELILNAVGNTFTAANTGANVSGFSTLGLDALVGSSTVDLSVFGAGIKNVIDIADTGSIVLNNVASTSTLTLDVSTASVIYTTGDTTGTTDTVTVTLASPVASTYAAGVANTATVLNLQDKLGQGIGHVNIVSNNVGFATPNVIFTLTDNNISALNISGTAGLTVSNLTAQSGASFTINNTDSGNYIDSTLFANVTLPTLTDTNLTNLTFAGSNSSYVAGVSDNTSVTGLTIANTGTSTAEVLALTAPQLTSLTLNGNVQLGPGNALGFGLADTATTGVTISGATDNSAVGIDLSGAVLNKTDSITLSNGNNYIVDTSTAGTVNVTVGSGANLIELGVLNPTTGSYSVTLGTHASTLTAFDQVWVGTLGSTFAVAPATLPVTNYVIQGAGAHDAIYLMSDVATTVATAVALNTNLNNPLFGAAAPSSTGGLIANLEVAAAAAVHSVQYAYFGGNTYIAEASGAASGTTMTLVELTGIHTIATTTATIGAGHLITLAS